MENYKDNYVIYAVDPKSDWIKVGYGIIHRPGSNDYWTGYGHNPYVTMWISNLNKKECFEVEKDLHKYLACLFDRGDAGKECYITNIKDVRNSIKKFIEEKYKNNFFDIYNTTGEEIRKIFSYNCNRLNYIENYTLIDFEKLIDIPITCSICNKKSTKISYTCYLIENVSENVSEKLEILTGPTCFKKFKNISENSSIFNEWFNKNINNDSNVIDIFIEQYLRDSRINVYPTNIKPDINNLFYKNVAPLVIRMILHFMLIEKKSFVVTIKQEDLEKYKFNIDILKIYYMIAGEPCEYLYIEDYDNEKHTFEVKLKHPIINSNEIQSFFKELYTTPYKYYKNLDFTEHKLSYTQQKALESHNPFVSGCPGTGKSEIQKYILCENNTDEILVISPTYTSLNLLLNYQYKVYDNIWHTVKNKSNMQGIVIDSWNSNVKIDTPDILLVDEFGMFNIFHFYKLKQIIDKYSPRHIKIVGDIYQLPCVGFENETKNILKYIQERSLQFTENWRAKEYPEEVNWLNNHKTCFKDLNSIKKVFTVEKYTNKKIKERMNLQKHAFLTFTNQSVNKINKICYEYYKKLKCKECTNSIKIKDYFFCKRCIVKFNWKVNGNIKFDKIKEKDMKFYDEISIEKYKEELKQKYNNRVLVHKTSKKIKYVKNSQEKSNNMLYNGVDIRIHVNDNDKYDIQIPINNTTMYIDSLNNINLNLSFCTTVHKSQGETKENITYILDKNNTKSRLLYTALTRAKNTANILILNDTNLVDDDITFESNDIISENNTDKKHILKKIYYPSSKQKPYYGQTYFSITKTCIESSSNKDKGWLNFMLGKVENKNPPEKHKDIFIKCYELYYN